MQLRGNTTHNMGWRYSEIIDAIYSKVSITDREYDSYEVGTIYEAQPFRDTDNKGSEAPSRVVQPEPGRVDSTEHGDVQGDTVGVPGEHEGIQEAPDMVERVDTVALSEDEHVSDIDFLEVEFT